MSSRSTKSWISIARVRCGSSSASSSRLRITYWSGAYSYPLTIFSYGTSLPSDSATRLCFTREPSPSRSSRKRTVCLETALKSLTGTFSSPKLIEPLHIALATRDHLDPGSFDTTEVTPGRVPRTGRELAPVMRAARLRAAYLLRPGPSGKFIAHISLTTSRGSLSLRIPLNAGWRKVPSSVHSVQLASQTSSGSHQTAVLAFGPDGAPTSKGLSGRSRLPSSRVNSLISSSVSPEPTPPAKWSVCDSPLPSSEAGRS